MLALVALATLPAHASNTKHKRTPMLWTGGGGAACGLPPLEPTCMIVHDRNEGPLNIPYRIPYEDTDVGAEEAPQSRTHQFVAFCRPHPIEEALPSWLSTADVAATEATEGLPPEGIKPNEILELRDDWDGCWYRMNADADRRAITCEMAEEGVDWDTADVPAGAYTINGYVYEPIYNFWILRPGVVKLHDGDPDAVGPAAAISTGATSIHRNEVAMIEGCVDAMTGSTLTAYWSLYGEGTPDWVAFASDRPIAGSTFEIEFTPPKALFGKIAMLRVDIEDPRGRSYTAFMTEKIPIINADAPGSCGGSFIGGSACDDTGGESSTSAATGETSTSPPDATSSSTTSLEPGSSEGPRPPGQSEPGGCGCGTVGGSAFAPFAWIALMARRRRRAAPPPISD
jgi:hypothetical protein